MLRWVGLRHREENENWLISLDETDWTTKPLCCNLNFYRPIVSVRPWVLHVWFIYLLNLASKSCNVANTNNEVPYVYDFFNSSSLSLRSFIQGIRQGPRLFGHFRNNLIFYGEELLAQRPTRRLEDHLLLAVRDCLFNIFAATLHTWRAFPPSDIWERL
jgi:hypothetical protein